MRAVSVCADTNTEIQILINIIMTCFKLNDLLR